ncbi:UNVERIFIED_CONTAM: hypothetical protein NCL1_09321 [Trichonephila clavipes]
MCNSDPRYPSLQEIATSLIPRNLERAEAVARYRLTTRHDFLGVFLHCLGLTANEACPLCDHARMDGDQAWAIIL